MKVVPQNKPSLHSGNRPQNTPTLKSGKTPSNQPKKIGGCSKCRGGRS